MTAEEILKKAKSVFNTPLSEEKKTEKVEEKKVELGEIITEDGATIYFDNELIQGSPIWFLADGESVPVPLGEYMLAGGKTLIVTEDGIVGVVTEPSAEATAEPEAAPAPEEQTLSAEDIKSIVLEAIKPLEEKITKLSGEKESAEKEVDKLKTELSEQPASDGVKSSPEGKKTTVKGVNLKARTNLDPVGRVYDMLYNSQVMGVITEVAKPRVIERNMPPKVKEPIEKKKILKRTKKVK